MKMIKVDYDSLGKSPALFVPILKQWINEGFNYFRSRKEKLYFYTNSNIGTVANLGIKSVYFKIKGDREITVKADFIDLTEENSVTYRLSGAENYTAKYYEFRGIPGTRHSIHFS